MDGSVWRPLAFVGGGGVNLHVDHSLGGVIGNSTGLELCSKVHVSCLKKHHKWDVALNAGLLHGWVMFPDRAPSFLGREGGHRDGGNSGGTSGGRTSWSTQRPATSRGGGDHHISPMLRPRQGQGFSHTVTPSPTFPAQHAVREPSTDHMLVLAALRVRL